MPHSVSGNGHRKGPWSQAEIDKLMSRYGQCPDPQLARELNRPIDSVRRMAKRQFSGDMRVGPWSASDVMKLRECFGVASIETLALVLRRSSSEIQTKIDDLRSSQVDRKWSRQDVQTLKRFYGTRVDSDLVVILGRSPESILAKADDLCHAKDKGFRRRKEGVGTTRMPRWSEEQLELLREMYPESCNLDIAQRLNRSEKSVVSKAHSLGLKKSKLRLRTMGQENVNKRYKPEDIDLAESQLEA